MKYLWSRYLVTTPEPGARLVFTQGLTWQTVKISTITTKKRTHKRKTMPFLPLPRNVEHIIVKISCWKWAERQFLKYLYQRLTFKPNSWAFFATRPAPSITLGFDVFVQLVIAAITTLPCLSSAGCPWKSNFATFPCASFGIANPCIERKHVG